MSSSSRTPAGAWARLVMAATALGAGTVAVVVAVLLIHAVLG